jgi:undecaprenyl-diphosphatase
MSLPVFAEGSALSAAILGLLQGLTEFLPVSSSGHLVLFQQFLTVSGDEVLFDLVLHLGTLLPVLFFYRKEVGTLITDPVVGEGPFMQRPGVRMLGLLILATIPTAIIGVALEDYFEALFSRPAALAITFTITGVLLFSTRYFGEGGHGIAKMKPWQAIVLGIAQGAAITPGISRSGTTIAVALFLGLKREDAARFSFLMSVPAILGAVVLKLKDASAGSLDPMSMTVGFLVALISGYFALVLLVGLVKRGGLPYFAFYCWLAAIAAFVISIVR